MSDEDTRQLDNTLLSTDDAMVWAEEFCRIFNGRTVATDVGGPDDEFIEPGAMVAWFASAMQTAVNQYERKKLRDTQLKEARETAATEHVSKEEREAFVEGVEDGRG